MTIFTVARLFFLVPPRLSHPSGHVTCKADTKLVSQVSTKLSTMHHKRRMFSGRPMMCHATNSQSFFCCHVLTRD